MTWRRRTCTADRRPAAEDVREGHSESFMRHVGYDSQEGEERKGKGRQTRKGLAGRREPSGVGDWPMQGVRLARPLIVNGASSFHVYRNRFAPWFCIHHNAPGQARGLQWQPHLRHGGRDVYAPQLAVSMT